MHPGLPEAGDVHGEFGPLSLQLTNGFNPPQPLNMEGSSMCLVLRSEMGKMGTPAGQGVAPAEPAGMDEEQAAAPEQRRRGHQRIAIRRGHHQDVEGEWQPCAQGGASWSGEGEQDGEWLTFLWQRDTARRSDKLGLIHAPHIGFKPCSWLFEGFAGMAPFPSGLEPLHYDPLHCF